MSLHDFPYARLTTGIFNLAVREVAIIARGLLPMHTIESEIALEHVQLDISPALNAAEVAMLTAAVDARRSLGTLIDRRVYMRGQTSMGADLTCKLRVELAEAIPGKAHLSVRMDGMRAFVEVHPPLTASEQTTADNVVMAHRANPSMASYTPLSVALIPTVPELPDAANGTGVVMVRESSGEAILVYSDGVHWIRAHDKSIIV